MDDKWKARVRGQTDGAVLSVKTAGHPGHRGRKERKIMQTDTERERTAGGRAGQEKTGIPEQCLSLRRISIGETDRIAVMGRTVPSRDPLYLYWTGSGVRFRIAASELWVELETAYRTYEQWITVVIDGEAISRQMLRRGRQFLCVFRNTDPSVCRTVQLLKDIQPMGQEPENLLAVHAIYTDGRLEAPEAPACRLEFVGDSVTSGEGAIGARGEMEWISEWFSAVRNYTWLTAKALKADYNIVSQCGWGVVCAWNNDPHGRVPDLYRGVCLAARGEKDRERGTCENWDFSAFRPDAVIVNLGANDANAFSQPAYTDPSTGETFGMRLNPDGTPDPADLMLFENAYTDFLRVVRECNPQAQIVACQGMFGDLLTPCTQSAVRRVQAETGDEKIHFLHLLPIREEEIGAREHPGIKAHRRFAAEIVEFLKTLPEFGKFTDKPVSADEQKN